METNEAAALTFSLAYLVIVLMAVLYLISTSKTWLAIKRWFSRKKNQ